MKKLYLTLCLATLCMLQSFGQVPILNSYPQAPEVIFLDFDGHYVNGTSWNWNGPITCGPSNMTTDQIKEIFERVAEDYRPFSINVTTDSTKYWSAPLRRRTRVVLTVTHEWYGTSAGGVSSSGSFSRGDNTPAFVFTKLLKFRTKDVAEAAAHEAGHTFGLRHQAIYNDACQRIKEYHDGVGTGEASWAPIMGVGYSRNVTTWHMGTSSRSCSSIQSDLEVITAPENGITFRTDDHGNAPKAATTLKFVGDSLMAEGLIETPTDNDYFAVKVDKASAFRLEVNPYSIGANNNGANLNVRVALVDAEQNEVATFSSASHLSETIDTVLAPGEYFLKVEGSEGQYFSSYGSLGLYSLRGTITPASTLPLRKLQLQGSTSGNAHVLRWVIDADEAIVRQVLEVSLNGSQFKPVSELDAESRQWQQQGPDAATVQYRLRVLFNNGREHLSNTILLRGGAAAASQRPHLASTLVNGSSIMMISPVDFRYQVCDMAGKTIFRGSAKSGSSGVHAGMLAQGVYLVKFYWDGGEHVEKMLKN